MNIRTMNIFLVVLPVLLSLWNIVGGVYMMGNHAALANSWARMTLPPVFWVVLAIVQIALACALLIASIKGSSRKIISPLALCLAFVSLLGTVLYTAYEGFPGILWSFIPASLLLFVAFKRNGTPQKS